MNIQFNALDRLFQQHQKAYEEAALRVLRSGWYIGGQEGDAFERAFAARMGVSYCVGLNSGLDALSIGLKALGIQAGDEVMVPANTYIATVFAVTQNLATPVFIEPDVYFNIDDSKLKNALTSRTKAIIPVHLYGQAANMRVITSFAKEYGLFLIEDCAQSHTARFDGQITGTFGDMGCFSFYPTKNLGAFGDAGAIVTNRADVAEKVRLLRNYGSDKKYHFKDQGFNSRLDELQAALLLERLKCIDQIRDERQLIANRYLQGIINPRIQLPRLREGAEHVFHLFVIQTKDRDGLVDYLAQNGIDTQIHYPIPPHLSACYRHLGYHMDDFPITERFANTILSLPLYNGMQEDEQQYVIEVINRYPA